jgi:type I restriction enzyme, S subunit
VIASLKPYAAYRDSGSEWLGDVPEGWGVRRLGSITTPVSKRGRSDLPLLSVLREKGVILREKGDANHNVIPEDLTNYKVVEPGNLVINKMKAWQGSLGVAATRGIVSPAYFVFGLNAIGRRYAHTLLRSRPYVGMFAAASNGIRVDQWDLSPVGMKAIPALIPSSAEQSAIVRFLDHVDSRIQGFIAAKERLVELLEEEKRVIVHQAVTRGLDPDARRVPSDVEWLGEVPEHWEVRKISQAFGLIGSGTTPASGNRKYYEGATVPWLVTGDLRDAEIHATSRKVSERALDEHSALKMYPPGSVVVAMYGATIGRAGLLRISACANQACCVLTRPRGLSPEYALLLFSGLRPHLVRLGVGGGQPNINQELIRQFRIPIPPGDEQQTILADAGRATVKLDSTIDVSRRQVDLLREYRTRLISDVVTGKLDVRQAAEKLPDEPGAEDPALEERLEGVVG